MCTHNGRDHRSRLLFLANVAARSFSEADLPGHLENGQTEESKDTGNEKNEEEAQRRDYQLRSALNLLKGMRILNSEKTPAAQPESSGDSGDAEEG